VNSKAQTLIIKAGLKKSLNNCIFFLSC
jgi:hypothetical protein